MRSMILVFLISVSLITVSCQKEDEKLAGELIAKELQTVIKENEIQRVYNLKLDQNWNNTWISGDHGRNYKFQGQFIFIEGVSYNLNNLIKYEIASKNLSNVNVKFLLLSFY
jgi:hypothetical protein